MPWNRPRLEGHENIGLGVQQRPGSRASYRPGDRAQYASNFHDQGNRLSQGSPNLRCLRLRTRICIDGSGRPTGPLLGARLPGLPHAPLSTCQPQDHVVLALAWAGRDVRRAWYRETIQQASGAVPQRISEFIGRVGFPSCPSSRKIHDLAFTMRSA